MLNSYILKDVAISIELCKNIILAQRIDLRTNRAVFDLSVKAFAILTNDLNIPCDTSLIEHQRKERSFLREERHTIIPTNRSNRYRLSCGPGLASG